MRSATVLVRRRIFLFATQKLRSRLKERVIFATKTMLDGVECQMVEQVANFVQKRDGRESA